jgi:peroxidase
MLSSLAVFFSCHTASSNAFERSSNRDYYSIDGSNNNLVFPEWGKRGTKRVRLMPNASGYFDSSHIPVDESNSQLPSARRIMEQVFSQSLPKADKGSNHLMLEFGHFIVQDTIGRTLTNDTDPFPMPCDGEIQDVLFCPMTGRSYSIPFPRSEHASGSSPRASMNGETAFLDMSNMYGNTNEAHTEVRSFEGGRVQLDEQGLPPILDKYNSSPGVFAMYCIFLRYHNILADVFAAEDPSLTDEELFQMARHRNIAIYQFNAEEKYIPTLLGTKLEPYVAYDPIVDPSIDEFFAAASFRYAHSSLSGLVRMLDENFDPITADPLILRDVFRQPSPNDVPRVIRNHGGIEVFLRGLTIQNSKSSDSSFVRDLNYFTEATSLLDIQRGRDLGLPSYNDAREAFGLSRLTSFEELAGYDYEDITDALKNLYGDVNKVDAYVGALVEAHNLGEEIGPLFTMSIKNQFERLRDGDRFWYRNQYTQEEWESFPSLAEVIKETCTGMDNFPSESFIAWDGVLDEALSNDTCGSSTQLSLIKYVHNTRLLFSLFPS